MTRPLISLTALLALVAAAPPARPPAITAEGWGTLKVGMPLAAIERAMGRDSRPGAVGGPEPDACDEFHPRRAPAGLIVMTERNRLSRISVTRPGLATDRGIRVGDTAAQVRAAYRGRTLRVEPHKYTDAPARYYTWLRDARRGIVYETNQKGRVASIHAGDANAIRYVEGCL